MEEREAGRGGVRRSTAVTGVAAGGEGDKMRRGGGDGGVCLSVCDVRSSSEVRVYASEGCVACECELGSGGESVCLSFCVRVLCRVCSSGSVAQRNGGGWGGWGRWTVRRRQRNANGRLDGGCCTRNERVRCARERSISRGYCTDTAWCRGVVAITVSACCSCVAGCGVCEASSI